MLNVVSGSKNFGADNDFEGRRWRPSVSEARLGLHVIELDGTSAELPAGEWGVPLAAELVVVREAFSSNLAEVV